MLVGLTESFVAGWKTGNVQYLLPLLVGVATAKAVGNHFNISIYDMQIEMKKFPFLHSTLSSLENLKEGEKPLTAEDIMAVGVVSVGLFLLVNGIENYKNVQLWIVCFALACPSGES